MGVYSRILEGALLPAYELVRGYHHCRHRSFVEESQWWSRERLQEFQWRELQKLLRHAFETVPYYQKRYAAAGIRAEDIRNWEDFARLPVLSREEINEHREELCSRAFPGKRISHATGGSSGVPLRFYITRDSFEWRCAVSERAYSWTGSRLGDRTLYLWGAAVGRQTRGAEMKMRLFRKLRRERMFNTFSQSEALWERVYRKAQQWKPELLVGYVSSLEAFCRWLVATGRARTLPGIRSAIAAAEPVYGSTRELVGEALGVPLFNTYGSREFMSIAGECQLHDGLHIHTENLVVESEAGKAGETSALLITDLHNFGMPFLRYRIGDFGALTTEPCGCGRGLPRLRAIEGRQLDVLRTADGRIVPGEFFPHLFKEFPEVRQFQARQEAIERIRILVVLDGEWSERSSSLLRRELLKVFGSGTAIDIDRVAAIPPLPSGKRRVTVGLGGGDGERTGTVQDRGDLDSQ